MKSNILHFPHPGLILHDRRITAMHNRLYRLSHGIMTALACLFTVLVFLLNVLYQSEVSYTAHEVTTISGSLKFSLLVLVVWAVLIVAAAFVRGRFPVRSIEEKAVLPADGALCARRPLPDPERKYHAARRRQINLQCRKGVPARRPLHVAKRQIYTAIRISSA